MALEETLILEYQCNVLEGNSTSQHIGLFGFRLSEVSFSGNLKDFSFLIPFGKPF